MTPEGKAIVYFALGWITGACVNYRLAKDQQEPGLALVLSLLATMFWPVVVAIFLVASLASALTKESKNG